MNDVVLDQEPQKSSKNYAVAVILSGIFGILGVHHFYCGRHLHGFIDLALSIGGFYYLWFSDMQYIGIILLAIDAIHTLIVTIQLLIGAYRDGDGKIIAYPGQQL